MLYHTNPEQGEKNAPLTKKELHETAVERVHLISKEFTDGFNFLRNYPRSVTIFGGSRLTDKSEYYKKAEALARKIVNELGYSVFTGGGPGIMEAANKGAFEADGESLGLTIDLPINRQPINKYLTENLQFYYFFSRKVCLSFSAEAYVFFPGGFGTLDEFFEIITLVQTGKVEKLPIILFGKEYWGAVDDLVRKLLLARGLIGERDEELYTMTDDENEIIDIIKNAPIRNGIKFEHSPKMADEF